MFFDISNFPEKITNLSPSVVLLYVYAVFIEEDLLVAPCYSLEFCV